MSLPRDIKEKIMLQMKGPSLRKANNNIVI